MVRCRDKTLYTGISNDVAKRMKAHNSGKGAKYIVVSRRPVKLIYVEKGFDLGGALKREAAIKRLDRKGKNGLIKGHRPE